MTTINQSILMLTSIVLLTSCTGQNPPVTSTAAGNTPPIVTNTLATSESFPFVITPSTTEIPATATSGSELNPTPTPASSVDVSSSGAFIPNTGELPTPNVSKKKNKFQDFTVPVSDESAFSLVPLTGFPKNVLTVIEPQPSDQKYSTTAITLEIPSLGIKLPVMGVPKKDGTWDVSWLWDQAGWLEGTAFPTMNGNSILTAHVVTADGKNGPFARLKLLTSDDYVFIINSGFRYIYSVDSINFVKPNDISVFSHEDDSWLTLITCDSYDEKIREYLLRVVVRSQLVEIQEIKR